MFNVISRKKFEWKSSGGLTTRNHQITNIILFLKQLEISSNRLFYELFYSLTGHGNFPKCPSYLLKEAVVRNISENTDFRPNN